MAISAGGTTRLATGRFPQSVRPGTAHPFRYWPTSEERQSALSYQWSAKAEKKRQPSRSTGKRRSPTAERRSEIDATIWRGKPAATPPRLVIRPRVRSGFRVAIKRGCSDRWRGGTGTLACDQGGCLPCIGHRHECLCHNRPCTRVPKRTDPDGVRGGGPSTRSSRCLLNL